jgi:hypothetical protein
MSLHLRWFRRNILFGLLKQLSFAVLAIKYLPLGTRTSHRRNKLLARALTKVRERNSQLMIKHSAPVTKPIFIFPRLPGSDTDSLGTIIKEINSNMKLSLLICVLSLSFLAPSIRAGDTSKGASPEMEKFSIFAGKWKLDEVDEASPFGPAGKATFKASSGFIYNGHFFQERGSGKVGDRKLDYTILTHFDSAAKKYRTIYYDSFGAVFVGDATLDGRTFKGRSSQQSNDGKTYQIKSETTLSEDGKKFTYEWLYSEDGKNWKPMFKGAGTRIGR